MQIGYLARFMLLMAFFISSVPVSAQEVTLAHRGLTLNGVLELAEDKTLADGVLLITHGALAHRDMDTIGYLRELLRERGYSTLSINLSLGLDNRQGMYDCSTPHRHTNDDAVEEIGLWLDWLKQKGAQPVVLLGHSRGGAQTALYAAERHDAVLGAVILMAPATSDNNSAEAYRNRHGQPLEPLLKQAGRMVADGNGEAFLEGVGLLTCADTAVTAQSFLSYYGQLPRLDTPQLLPKIKAPTLVVVAGDDRVVVGLDKKLEPLVDAGRIRMAVVEGADHMFRDIYADEAVEAIDAFLQEPGE
ncbi:MAG: alpha/beta hydrolase [Haliea sp.]